MYLFKGLWKQDKYHGDGRLIYEGQTVFEGEFLEGSAKFKPSRITLDKNMMKVNQQYDLLNYKKTVKGTV